MAKQPILISSLGLKNIVFNKFHEEEKISFIFGEQKFEMNCFLAEFISPIVSNLHKADPTINTVDFIKLYQNQNKEFNELSRTILTPSIISLLIQISSGDLIEINEDQAIKLRFLSIILGNEELHDKLNELFPPNFNEENIDSYLKNIECYYNFSQFKRDFDFKSLLTFISSHFYKLNKDDFIKLPRKIQYEIISHPKLQIESEDSLFDIVFEIIERSQNGVEGIDDVLFLEQVEFGCLSEDRLHIFVDFFDFNEMNASLWHKLIECIFGHSIKRSKRSVNRSKTTIIIGGYNNYNQLIEKSNNKDVLDGNPIISPPVKSSYDPSNLLSYSVFGWHMVSVTNKGSLFGIGSNGKGRIISSLPRTQINQLTEFTINDPNNGFKLIPISAFCGGFGTLYMLSKNNGNDKQLVYCDKEINDGKPTFLDIGDVEPVALFGGGICQAAICSKGEIIFVNRNAVHNSPTSQIEAVSLPENEKASSVACLNDSVFVLSTTGRVFFSPFEKGSNIFNFSEVKELAEEEIICISGTWKHCLAVSKNGVVYGYGSNECGKIGLGEETELISSFTEITSLHGYNIRAAYTGCNHSFFETIDGKILSCGSNCHGQLFLSKGQSSENVYLPTETTITSGASFCILGDCLSIVFVGGDPPPNQPNRKIQI